MCPCGSQNLLRDRIEDGIETFCHPWAGCRSVEAKAQRDQIESTVTTACAVPVDHPCDHSLVRQHVPRMEILVHRVITGQLRRMIRADSGDPPLQRRTAAIVPPEWLMQAVTDTVVAQMKVHRGDIDPSHKPVGLQLVQLKCLAQLTAAEVFDLPSRQQFLHHDHCMPNLGDELGSRSRIARQPQRLGDSKRSSLHVFDRAMRPPLQNGPVTVRPADVRRPDLPTWTRTFQRQDHTGPRAKAFDHASGVKPLNTRPLWRGRTHPAIIR